MGLVSLIAGVSLAASLLPTVRNEGGLTWRMCSSSSHTIGCITLMSFRFSFVDGDGSGVFDCWRQLGSESASHSEK